MKWFDTAVIGQIAYEIINKLIVKIWLWLLLKNIAGTH